MARLVSLLAHFATVPLCMLPWAARVCVNYCVSLLCPSSLSVGDCVRLLSALGLPACCRRRVGHHLRKAADHCRQRGSGRLLEASHRFVWHPFLCLSLFVCVCVSLSNCFCLCPSVPVCLCPSLSVCLSASVSVCLRRCTPLTFFCCAAGRRLGHSVLRRPRRLLCRPS